MRAGLGCLCGWLVLAAAHPTPAGAFEAANACGCYRDDKGACKCARKSKCGCPEECEPIGCEAKREREADRAADVALKEIAARERKRSAEAASEANQKARLAAKAAKTAAKDAEQSRVAARAAEKALDADGKVKPPHKTSAKLDVGGAKSAREFQP